MSFNNEEQRKIHSIPMAKKLPQRFNQNTNKEQFKKSNNELNKTFSKFENQGVVKKVPFKTKEQENSKSSLSYQFEQNQPKFRYSLLEENTKKPILRTEQPNVSSKKLAKPTNCNNKIEKKNSQKVSLSPQGFKPQVILPKKTAATPVQSFPDSFYELTASEAKSLIQSFKQKDHLVSKSYQEEQRIIRNSKYKKTTIKIKFPDNTELIRCFHPLNTSNDVYVFVEKSLRSQWKFALKFGSGERELIENDQTTLAKLNLVPGAVLLIVFEDFKMIEKPYLNEELMSNAIEKE